MSEDLVVGHGRFDAYRTESHKPVKFTASVKSDLEQFIAWMDKRDLPHPALKDFLRSEVNEFKRDQARSR